MRLHEAFEVVVEDFGQEVIKSPLLYNILTDYCTFADKRERRVVRVFVELGYGNKFFELLGDDSADKAFQIQNCILNLVQNEGLKENVVKYVIGCFSYGLGLSEEPAKEIIQDVSESITETKSFDIYGVDFKMIQVKGGTFSMGATPEQGVFALYDEKPSVEVSLGDFYLGETLVTQKLWCALMNSNPSHFIGHDLPVERVSWEECQQFIKKLNVLFQESFRLPTEAEWEFAARGGICSMHKKYSGAMDDALEQVAWFKDNSNITSHNVKTKLPNELGLYDMSGNVAEWCNDWYFNSYANGCSKTNPIGPANGNNKVFRGGSWNNKASDLRVSRRFFMNPIYRNKLVGFRLAASNF